MRAEWTLWCSDVDVARLSPADSSPWLQAPALLQGALAQCPQSHPGCKFWGEKSSLVPQSGGLRGAERLGSVQPPPSSLAEGCSPPLAGPVTQISSGRLPGLGTSQGLQRPLCPGQMASGSSRRGCQHLRSGFWPRLLTLPYPAQAVRCCLLRGPARGLPFRCLLPEPPRAL